MASAETAAKAFVMIKATWPKHAEHYDKDPLIKQFLMEMLMKFPDAVLLKSLHNLTLTRPTLYPNDNLIALIGLEASRGAAGEKPDEVIEWISRMVQARGRYYDGGWPSDLHEYAVKSAGGWLALCDSSPEFFQTKLEQIRKVLVTRASEHQRTAMLEPRSLELVEGVADRKALGDE